MTNRETTASAVPILVSGANNVETFFSLLEKQRMAHSVAGAKDSGLPFSLVKLARMFKTWRL
jgi:hypothetical protein